MGKACDHLIIDELQIWNKVIDIVQEFFLIQKAS